MRLSSFQKTLLIELKSLESTMMAVVIVQSSDDIVLLNAWWLHDCMWPIRPMWVVQSWWVKVASRFANWRSFLTIRDGANRPDFGGTGIGLLITIFQGNSLAFQFSFVLVVQIKRPNQLFLFRLPPLYPTLELPLTVPFPFSSCYVLLPCFALLVYRTRMIPRFPANLTRQQSRLPLASDSPFMVFRSCRKSRAVGAVLVFV